MSGILYEGTVCKAGGSSLQLYPAASHGLRERTQLLLLHRHIPRQDILCTDNPQESTYCAQIQPWTGHIVHRYIPGQNIWSTGRHTSDVWQNNFAGCGGVEEIVAVVPFFID